MPRCWYQEANDNTLLAAKNIAKTKALFFLAYIKLSMIVNVVKTNAWLKRLFSTIQVLPDLFTSVYDQLKSAISASIVELDVDTVYIFADLFI